MHENNDSYDLARESKIALAESTESYLPLVKDLDPSQVEKIYDLLTNSGENETYVNQMVRGVTGQETLYPSQRLVLAPANAIENSGRALIDLVNPSSWSRICGSLGRIFSGEFVDTIKACFVIFYDKLGPTEKAAFAAEFAASIPLMNAMVARFTGILMHLVRAKEVMMATKTLTLNQVVNQALSKYTLAFDAAQDISSVSKEN